MDHRQLLKLQTMLLGVLAALGIGATLYFARTVIVPFALALFAAFAVEPAIRLLQRLKVPRWLGALVVVGSLFLLIQAVGRIVAGTAAQFRDNVPAYLESLQRLAERLPIPQSVLENVPLDDPELWSQILPIQALVGSVGSWAGALTAFIGTTVLVLMLMVAMVIARKSFDERLDQAAGSATGQFEEAARVIDAIDAGIQRYMLLKILLSVAVGVGLYGVLRLFGVDYADLWGFLGFMFNFIPTVGPIVATIPVVLMAFLQFGDNPGYALVASAVAGAVPFIVGNVIEPKVFGDSLNLNFVAVLFALVLWAFLWGVPGAVLSVPIMMAVNVVCREVPALRPIHELMRA